MSPLARSFMALSNRRGILHNWDDGPADLDAALAATFGEREVRVHGALALFSAR
jgi:hypothetical protein